MGVILCSSEQLVQGSASSRTFPISEPLAELFRPAAQVSIDHLFQSEFFTVLGIYHATSQDYIRLK